MTRATTGVIERYLSCLAAHDWDGVAATLVDDGLVREGPWCEVVEGKDEYVAYLRNVITRLKGHRLQIHRVSHVESRSFVELTESFEFDGVPTEWPECLLFERGDDPSQSGLISRVSVYFKQPGAAPEMPE
ncbi:nuclear transport factor 2 family protein [Mycobacterium paragordonae]|uniref:nuclear transport factor 2 family protein n=1 Tax=Mycobacterium paragordonae TaxID=1389713 RepID=UPI0012E24E6D|nr:nuclear transport factor 2 family protein [Mycobacterium paragordonae]